MPPAALATGQFAAARSTSGAPSPELNGTGNNLAIRNAEAEAPRWDLIKQFQGGPSFTTQTINGVPVDGYIVDYLFTILDLEGPGNVAPWLDRPVTFTDHLVSHPDAILLHCRQHTTGSPARVNGTATCETGAQPADGWDMSFVPDGVGFERRRGDFIARVFIPLDQIEGNLCSPNVTLDLRNEAINSDGWTAGGVLNNGTGFEPGWNGTTATGNNLLINRIRPSTADCGTLTGDKNFTWNGTFLNNGATFGNDTVNSWVTLSANNGRVSVEDLRMCDVFDVSVFRLDEATPAIGGAGIDPADYIIEYAIGPNNVDTQAGPLDTGGTFPIERTDLVAAAAGCRTHAGPWSANPVVDFGADWRDQVNMVRARPIDPSHVETGPFSAFFSLNLDVRVFYNGGPDAGQPIPSGALLTNVGGLPTGPTGEGWRSVTRNMIFRGMSMLLYKSATPTQYLPGSTVVWDLSLQHDAHDCRGDHA